jgi:hypothetical protein
MRVDQEAGRGDGSDAEMAATAATAAVQGRAHSPIPLLGGS